MSISSFSNKLGFCNELQNFLLNKMNTIPNVIILNHCATLDAQLLLFYYSHPVKERICEYNVYQGIKIFIR